MPVNWFDGVGDEALFTTAQNLEDRANQYRQSFTDPNVASRAGAVYRNSPWLKPGEIISFAKGNISGQGEALASTAAARRAVAETDITRPKKKGWFERNVHDKLKAGTRWLFAGLNFTPDVTQNVASKIFSGDGNFDGWFKSTQLGTMFENSGQAGEGYFMGGAAAEKQAERAREFRGTINGHAWTIGRGAADILFTPGSKEYNLLSGFVDAAVSIYADPTLYAGQAVKAARAGGELERGLIGTKAVSESLGKSLLKVGVVREAAIPTLKTAEEISLAAKLAERGYAGLNEAEMLAWDSSKVGQWMKTDSRAIRLIDRLTKETDAYAIFDDAFKGNIDPTVAKRFAEATTPEQVQGILAEATRRLDNAAAGIIPRDIRDIAAAKAIYLRDRAPLQALRTSRLLTDVPGIDIVFGTPQDAARSIKNVANYLDTAGDIKSTSVRGRELLNGLIDAYSKGEAFKLQALTDQVDTLLKETIADKFKASLGEKGAREFADEVFKKAREGRDQLRSYFVDEHGAAYDAGYIQEALDSGKISGDVVSAIPPHVLEQLRLHGAGLMLEMIDKVHYLPDPRVMRRITANPFFGRALVASKTGDPRRAVALAEYVQNKIWKPLTLATGGYIMRNMFDAQVRLATTGAPGFFNHPWQYLQYVLHRKAPADIFANTFNSKVDEEVAQFAQNLTEWEEAMTFGISRYIKDPVGTARRGVKTGNYTIVNRLGNRNGWKDGLQLEWRQLAFDRIGSAYAKGLRGQELLDYVRKFPDGSRKIEGLRDLLRRGIRTLDQTGKYVDLPGNPNPTDDDLLTWIDRLVGERLRIKTGGNPEYAQVIAYRRVPTGPEFLERADNLLPGSVIDGPTTPSVGTIYDAGGGQQAIITAVEEVDGVRRFRARPVSMHDIFDSPKGRAEFADYVETVADDTTLPNIVKYAETAVKKPDQNLWDRSVSWVFGGHGLSYGRLSQIWERSPLYRYNYYGEIADNADLLSRSEAERLVTLIQENSAAAGLKPADYVGSSSNYDKIRSALANPEGVGTVEQLQEYAQVMALNSTKETLYNAASRSNLEDILRVAIPFGVAWREVLSTYAKFLIEDPTRIRRAQLVYTGLSNADPENDGQGFFYKDPVSGENVFNFPFSGEFAKLLTGVNAPLQARVKGVSIGLNVTPAVGPLVQAAASAFMPDSPKTDAIVEFLLPYGRRDFTLLPSWASKLRSALLDQPGKLDSIYANTYMETVRALSASGDYSLDADTDKQRLFDDARIRARILTSMRAVAQFIGPAAPSTEFMVPTKEGDVMASALTAEFYKLQKNNYDTAVPEFLRIYGDDAMLYLASKSKATVDGLEATKTFGDWERQNESLIASYPGEAAYFAPGGDDFSFSVWERQIRTGKRERLTDQEMVAEAQRKIGSSLYRAARNQMPTYPSEDQRAWLRNYRLQISAVYPGYPPASEFVPNELQNKMFRFRQLLDNPRLADNDVAKALRDYFGYRDAAIRELASAGLSEQALGSAKAAEPLRDWLANIGQVIVSQYPDFARLWERELSYEVER